MLKHLVTTAWRNMVRHKAFTIINLIGLSVGMSLGLLIIEVVHEQYSFDDFHSDADRIYRINTRALRVEGGSELYASAPLPLGGALKEEYTFVDELVRISKFRDNLKYNDLEVPVKGLFVDPTFLHVFNFQLEVGNSKTAFEGPNNIIITSETREKIFGNTDPIGRTITFERIGLFVVTGVLKKFPGRTHFDFEALVPSSALPLLEIGKILNTGLEDWNDYYRGYVYFKMKPNRSSKEAERALDELFKKYYANRQLETRDKGYEFELNRLDGITPGPELSNQMGTGMPILLIAFMSVLAVVVLLMACFNYNNLVLAKSFSRAREIGVRKVNGARRWQIFAQFIGEALVFAMTALIFSCLLLQILKPAFTQLYFLKEFSSSLNEDYVVYFYFILFAAAIGIVAGALPATYLSTFQPVRVLKDIGSMKILSRFTIRQALVVIQFALSVAFIIIVMVVYQQVSFMVKKDYNFREEGIYNVYLNGMPFEKLANEVRQLPGVLNVGGVSHALGTYADRYGDFKRTPDGERLHIRDFTVDENYISNLGFEILAGSNFNPATQGQFERDVILNERALREFNFANPNEAIGQSIFAGDSIVLTVIGVVKDFNFRPLNYEIGPLVLSYNLKKLNILNVSFVPSEQKSVIASIEAVWRKLDPIHPINGMMMKDQLDDAYWNGGFRDIIQVVGYISFLVIILACLGILGMSMYSTQARTKEIGVRKVMGASAQQITFLLSRTFLHLILFGILIGLPAGYWMGYAFIADFAYRIDITITTLATGVAFVILMGMVATASQTWKAAQTDPVKSLRYE